MFLVLLFRTVAILVGFLSACRSDLKTGDSCLLQNYYFAAMPASHPFLLLSSSLPQQPNTGYGRLIIKVCRLHSVGLLWTDDRADPQTSTWQRTTLTRDRRSCPGGIRTRSLSKLWTSDLCPRPLNHKDLLPSHYTIHIHELFCNSACWTWSVCAVSCCTLTFVTISLSSWLPSFKD